MGAPRILVLDNYDSFTFNLVQYLGELGADLEVVRNDRIELSELAGRRPDGVVISPGPGVPSKAGVSVPLVRWCADRRVPLLGVCLGHQAIGEAFGGRIVRAGRIMHGKTSQIRHTAEGVLAGLPDPFEATRYHSLVLDAATVPVELRVTAHTVDDGEIMALAHTDLPIHGVQFHPESILTAEGMRILRNYLDTLSPVGTPGEGGRSN